jgi:hypothetical protein
MDQVNQPLVLPVTEAEDTANNKKAASGAYLSSIFLMAPNPYTSMGRRCGIRRDQAAASRRF